MTGDVRDEPAAGGAPSGARHPGGDGDPDHARLEASRMPLRAHLEELRRCLIRSFIAFVVLFFVGFYLKDELIRFVMLPYEWARQRIVENGDPDPGKLVFIRPAEAFIFAMKVAGSFALLGGAPVFLREVWSFVAAGLLERERKAVYKAFPFAVGLFLLGLVFGFTVLLQLAYPILLTFLQEDVAGASITLSEYFASLRSLTLLMGLVFELPILMWLLVRAGMMQYATLASNRRMALVLTLVFAAIMTPPDVVTQVLVAIPMAVLYELGLLLARRAEKQRIASTGV